VNLKVLQSTKSSDVPKPPLPLLTADNLWDASAVLDEDHATAAAVAPTHNDDLSDECNCDDDGGMGMCLFVCILHRSLYQYQFTGIGTTAAAAFGSNDVSAMLAMASSMTAVKASLSVAAAMITPPADTSPLTALKATNSIASNRRPTRAETKIQTMSGEFLRKLFEATGDWATSTLGMAL
jgi:hypothetical protein